jgi:hypothetical protein
MKRVLAGLLLLASWAGAADAPSVVARASKQKVTVGETFGVEVEATGPPGTTWTFPTEMPGETIELRAHAEARPVPGRMGYDALVFALKDVAVPPIEVAYKLPDGTSGKVQTAPIPLEIASMLPRDTKEGQIEDIRPPVSIGLFDREFWIALFQLLTQTVGGLLFLAAVAGLLYWLWRRRRKRQRAEAPVATAAPQASPDEEAMSALDRLAASGLVAREDFRPFYISLTEIAKRYLERRLKAAVLEMTTAETLAFLRQDANGNAFVDLVRDVASAADQIKFARGQGAREMAEGHLGAVRRLVLDLERRLRPAAVEPPGGHAVSSTKRT